MKQFSKDLGNVCLAPKGKWSREQEYERLALVYNACDNLSYVAKTNVPIGVEIDNSEYWQPMNATGYADNNFINLTIENENGTITAYETLEEAVATILPINRRAGATLSFYNLNSDRLDRQAEFELWQFNSTDLANWENKDYWNNIYYNWNVFAGWYIDADALKNHVETPNVGQYAYVGSNLNDALLYQCRTNGTWTNTGIKVRNYISVVVSGNITIGENGNWFSDGEDTGIPATPVVDEQLDNIITKHESLSKTVQGILTNLFRNEEIKLESTGDKSTTNALGDFAVYNTGIFMAGTIVKSIKLKVSSQYVNSSNYYCKLAVVNKLSNNNFTINQESEKFKIDNSKEGIITIQTNFEFKTEGLIGIGFSSNFSPLYAGTPSGYNGFFYNIEGYNPDIDNSIIYLPQFIKKSYGVSLYIQVKYIPASFITRSELEEAVKNIKSFTNYLDGKNILAVGDSMVAGHSIPDSSGNTWLAKIATRNNMTRYNRGTNGAKMAKIAYGGTTDNSVYSKICENGTSMYINDEIMNSVDYILIYAGTNDIAANVTIGELSSSNPQEFCGALNLICQNLQTRAPQSHIGFITPQLRAGIEQKCWDYINAIENICKKYSIPVYNQGINSGICWTNTAIKNTLTLNDTYHLNIKGMEFISYKYEGFLREI